MKKSSSVFSCNPSNKYPKLNRKIYFIFFFLCYIVGCFGCLETEIWLFVLDRWRLRLLWLILYFFLYYCTMRNGVRRTMLSNSASLSKLIDTKIQLVEKQRNHRPPLSLPAPGGSEKGNKLKSEDLWESAETQPSVCLLLLLPFLFSLSSTLSFPLFSLLRGSERGWIKQDCD